MSFRLDTPSRRIALAIGISVALHALLLWGPNIRVPSLGPSLPTLTARLEALPDAPAKPKARRKAKPAVPKAAPEPAAKIETPAPPQDVPLAASEPATAASAAAETGPLAAAAESTSTDERPPLPRQAQLTFAINMGNGGLRIGEAIHTLEIHDGRYVLKSMTTTVGLARLFKSYQLNQYSNGSYGRDGLLPELFTEERIDALGTQRNAVEFDHAEQRAIFSNGADVALLPETQDILSVMYQFPPLAHTEVTTVYVSNGKKIEHYDFEVAVNETIDTQLGKLLTVRLSKMHAPNEEGLEIWLAREYRLFPVKMRFIERDGKIAGEAVITDIRVSEERGERNNAVN